MSAFQATQEDCIKRQSTFGCFFHCLWHPQHAKRTLQQGARALLPPSHSYFLAPVPFNQAGVQFNY